MWIYQKNLEYPVNIKRPDPKMAQIILSQYGGAYCKCLSSPINAAKTRILATFRLLLL